MTALDTARAPVLARRRYRLGLSLFLGSARWLRWIVPAWVVLTPLLSLLFSDAVETGLWRITATVFQWFVASVAGMWFYQNLPGTIARGVTRREVTTAYLIFGVLASVATAALVTAGALAEHALLTAFAEPADTWAGTLATGARYLVITPIYFFTGALIGASAIRFGGGNLFTIIVLVAASGHYAGILALEFEFFGTGGGLALWLGVCLAVIAVLVAGVVAVVRTIPVRSRS
ncbi:hypothetical protein GCM10009830_30900 [Glycomyces endophyticus]|uniref:ABC transporter permease n=1 Tax=Glycomyces endophyticus TaxID=480996 RepID=A0ABN2H3V7_9ACTN